MLTRPDRTEYADFYANYIAKVPDGDVIAFLTNQPAAYRKLLGKLSDEQGSARPQPGKWNVKEIIGHLCDAERIQSYRALRFARAISTNCMDSSKTTTFSKPILTRGN